ncbi:MAG: leucine-rich repeat domain-containing protein [Nitrososphaerota archaeon]|nr:leucine-rich repeat domain-containing protein [Nitrososphaerota archaeon]
MDDKIISVLLNVKELYGDTIFTDKKRLNNILKDLLIGEVKYADCKGKITAFTHAIDEHAYDELTQHKDNPEKTQKYYINELRRTYNDEVAIFVVNALSKIIGIKTVPTFNTKTRTGIKSIPAMLATNNPQTTNSTRSVKVLTETEAKKLAGARITIPDGYTEIGYHAFFSRTNLESVTIPNSVTRISKEAFYNCKKLTNINVSDNITYISKNAFMLCEKLSNISVSEKNRHFSSQDGVLFNKPKTALLYYPLGIKHNTYTIPISVIHLVDKAFYNRKRLTDIQIPNNVTGIGESTFSGAGITKIFLPNTITRIRRFTFSNCKALTRVIIPNSVTIIGERAFAGCTKLSNITIPDNVTKIGNNIFEYTKVTVICTKNSPIQNYCLKNSIKIKLVDTNTKNPQITNITNIQTSNARNSSGGVEHNKILTEDEAKNLTGSRVIIPPIYNEVGSYAFRSRANLERVIIHSGITNISCTAFCGCTMLSAILVSEKNQHYTSTKGGLFAQNGVLYNKNKTTLICYPAGIKKSSYTIPIGVTHVGEFAFFGCEKLKNVIMPKSVVFVGESAFYHCKELSNVTIPNSVTRINKASFSGCKKLKNVTISNGVTHIDEFAFESCEKLKNVTLPQSVVSIGKSVFRQCVELSNVNIPDSVTRIEKDTFSGCKKLKNITIPNGVTHIGESAFEGCENLKNINLPKSVSSIEKSAFRQCKGLKKISIPMGVESIDEDTLAFCNKLSNITIPDSVTSIGNNAFQDVSNLIVLCSKNSFAHNYCLKNKIKVRFVYFIKNKS